MLEITIPGSEEFNESTGEFIVYDPVTLRLEHSLLSVSKWESFFKKPFLKSAKLNADEIRYYVQCMEVGSIHAPSLFFRLTTENIKAIEAYIADSHTATVINEIRKSKTPTSRNKVQTSESLYAAMFTRGIPIETETWNLNRLLTLIRVMDVENGTSGNNGKMSRAESAQWQREQNLARRARAKKR